MAWQLTIDNSKNYDFSIFNSQLSTQTIVNCNCQLKNSYSCYSYFSNGSL